MKTIVNTGLVRTAVIGAYATGFIYGIARNHEPAKNIAPWALAILMYGVVETKRKGNGPRTQASIRHADGKLRLHVEACKLIAEGRSVDELRPTVTAPSMYNWLEDNGYDAQHIAANAGMVLGTLSGGALAYGGLELALSQEPLQAITTVGAGMLSGYLSHLMLGPHQEALGYEESIRDPPTDELIEIPPVHQIGSNGTLTPIK
jgi:hypothetical protein